MPLIPPEFHFFAAIAVFVATLVLVFTERINRTTASMGGALLMVVFGILGGEDAYEAVNIPTFMTIIGTLVVISVVRSGGLFSYLAIKAAKAVKGNPAKMLFVFFVLSAIVASFLRGSATIMIMGGLVVTIARQLNQKAGPYLIACAIAASIGGAMFFTGSTSTLVISQTGNFSFFDFISNSFFISIAVAIALGLFSVRYFKAEDKDVSGGILLDEKAAISNWKLFFVSSGILVLMILLLSFGKYFGIGTEISAIGCGILALLATGISTEKTLSEIPWDTIFFLMGMFVVVGGIEKVGLLSAAAGAIAPLINGKAGLLAILWGAGLISGFVPSLPLTMSLLPMFSQISETTGQALAPMLWALILGVNFGENLTPLGSSSSVLAMGIGRNTGNPIDLKEFFKASAITTFLTFLAASVWILIRY